LSITPAFQNMPRQSHQRGKGGLWVVDYSKPDVYSRKVGARRVAYRSPIRFADALLDPCVSLSQRGKRGPSAKSSPKSDAVPLLPYGLVSMGADQDGTDEASGSGSGWSSTDDHAGGRYHPGPGSNWSLSPQMPLEASPAAYYPATGQPVPQTFASAYQPMTMCPPGASSSTSSRSSIASPTTNEFPPRFAFDVPSGLPGQPLLEAKTGQHLMPAWSQSTLPPHPLHQPPQHGATQAIYTYSSPSAGHRQSEVGGGQWAALNVQIDDNEIIGATGWTVAPPQQKQQQQPMTVDLTHHQHQPSHTRSTPYPVSPRHVRGLSFKEAHPARPATAPRQLSTSAIPHVRPGPYDYPLQQAPPPSLVTLRSLSASQIPTIAGSGYRSPSSQSGREPSPVAAPLPSPSVLQPVSPALQINGVADGYFDIKPRSSMGPVSTPGSEAGLQSPYESSPRSPYELSPWKGAPPPLPPQPLRASLGQLTPPVTGYRRSHGLGHRPYASLGSTTEAISAFQLHDHEHATTHMAVSGGGGNEHLTDGSDDTEQPTSRSRFGSLSDGLPAAGPAYLGGGALLGVPSTQPPPALVLATPPWYPA
jgi:hypothetical protein